MKLKYYMPLAALAFVTAAWAIPHYLSKHPEILSFLDISHPEEVEEKSAFYLSGRAHLLGEGVEKNIDQAREELEKGAREGDVDALNLLIAHYEEANETEAYVEWSTYAFQKGYNNYARALSVFYWEEGNWEEAIRWAHLAHEKKVSDADLLLGILYSRTENPVRDDEAGMAWLKKAQRRGNQDAARFMYSIFMRQS